MSNPPTAIYRNTRSHRVRALQYGCWLAALASSLVGSVLQAASQGDSLGDALLILAPLLVLVALGMEVYGSVYVTAMEAEPAGLWVETLAWSIVRPTGTSVRTHRRRGQRTLLPWGTLPNSWEERGYHARSQYSSAVLLRRPGARLPFIIDTTDNAVDEQALARLRRRYTAVGRSELRRQID